MKAGLGLGQGQGAGNQTAVATRRRGPNRREPGARASWGQRVERARQCSRAPAVTSGCGSALTTSPSTQGPAGTPDLCSGREAAWRPCTAGGPAGHALAPRPCFCHELGPGKASGRKTPGRISGRRNAPRERIKSQRLHNRHQELRGAWAHRKHAPSEGRDQGTKRSEPGIHGPRGRRHTERRLNSPLGPGPWASQASGLQAPTFVPDTSMQLVCLWVPEAAFLTLSGISAATDESTRACGGVQTQTGNVVGA